MTTAAAVAGGRSNADLSQTEKEISLKTIKIIQLEQKISKLTLDLKNKNTMIEHLKIKHKFAKNSQLDELHLQLEEYKNESQCLRNEIQEKHQQHLSLLRQFNGLQSQIKSQNIKHENIENNLKISLDSNEQMYKQRMSTLASMHASQLKVSNEKIEMFKKYQLLSSNKQVQQTKHSLQELQESHERIENDYQQQIEDMKNIMIQREKEKQRLVQEMSKHYDQYKEYSEQEIEHLQEKVDKFNNNEIEIRLSIDVSDSQSFTKPPPNHPAPKPSLSIHVNEDENSLSADDGSESEVEEIESITDSSSMKNRSKSSVSTFLSPSKSERIANHLPYTPELEDVDHSHPQSAHHTYGGLSGNDIFMTFKQKVRDTFTPKPPTSVGGGRRYTRGYQSAARRYSRLRVHSRAMSTRSDVSFGGSQFSYNSDNLSLRSSEFGIPVFSDGISSSKTSTARDSNVQKLHRMMLEQDKAMLAEDLKLAHKKNIRMKEQVFRKIKQMQLGTQAERAQWKLREIEMQNEMKDILKSKMEIEEMLNERIRGMQQKISLPVQSYGNSSQPPSPVMFAQMAQLQLQMMQVQQKNQSLVQQNEKFRREIMNGKKTIMNCTETMKAQQKQIYSLNVQIQKNSYFSRNRNGNREKSSAKMTETDMMSKQVYILKKQRKMLLSEMKNMRQVNEKLQAIIVRGRKSPSAVSSNLS